MAKQKEKNVRENCARTKKGMRRMRLFAGLFACLLGVGLLAGCAGKIEQDQENAEGKGEHQKGGGTVIEDIDFSFLAEEEGTWKDNSLDDWQAVINQKVEPVLLEGEDEYSFGNRIGEGGFLFFSNHIVYSNNGTEYQYQWSGINGIRATGEEFSLRLDLEATPEFDLKSHQESDLGSGLTSDLMEANGYPSCKMARYVAIAFTDWMRTFMNYGARSWRTNHSPLFPSWGMRRETYISCSERMLC